MSILLEREHDFKRLGRELSWKTTIMDRYLVRGTDFLGQGSFSVVRKAFDKRLKRDVAIKTYIDNSPSVYGKFKRQIEILKHLQEPLHKNEVHRTATESFRIADIHKEQGEYPNQAKELLAQARLDPRKVFVKLLDYSQDCDGHPSPARDGHCYVVLELASYTLEDYLNDRREARDPMEMWEVHHVIRSLISITAILHAKGLVHLDIKPGNIMRVEDDWKLIDVDGAVPASTTIDLDDNTVSFTPLYCAPEFARALVDGSEALRISRMMDVWSVGVTALDLILAKPALESKYVSLYDRTGDSVAFFDWLASNTTQVRVPVRLKWVDEDLYDLIQNKLLVKRTTERASVLECLEHPFCIKRFEIPASDSAAKSYIFDLFEGPPAANLTVSEAASQHSLTSPLYDYSSGVIRDGVISNHDRAQQQHVSNDEELHSGMTIETAVPVYGPRGNLERRRSAITHMKPDGSVEPFHKIMEEETMKRGKRISVAQITQINKIIKYHSSATNDKDDENTDVNRLNGWANTQEEDADIDRKYPTTHQQPLGPVHTNLPGQTRGGDSDNGGGENKRSPKNDGGEMVNTYSALAVPATCPLEVHDTTSEGLMVPRPSIVIQNPTALLSLKPKRSISDRFCKIQ